MQFELKQRGRASMDFMVSVAQGTFAATKAVDAELERAGVTAETMDPDLDRRMAQVDAALAQGTAGGTARLLGDFLSTQHGRYAIEAFEQVREDVEPKLHRAGQGPTTLNADPDFQVPAYFDGVEFHRTTGGWDGHEHMGFIHGELIHKHYVAKASPVDIFAARRRVLDELPHRDFKRIFEMGTSSGHYTLQIADAFPDAHITGCDLSLAMLKQAQRVANERGYAWTLLRVPAEETGLPDAGFDLVTSYIVLHEIPGRIVEAQFREAFRLLEPGGWMLVTDVVPYRALDRKAEWRAEYLARNGGEPYWREAATIDHVALCREIGFTEAESYGLYGASYPWVTKARKPLR